MQKPKKALQSKIYYGAEDLWENAIPSFFGNSFCEYDYAMHKASYENIACTY